MKIYTVAYTPRDDRIVKAKKLLRHRAFNDKVCLFVHSKKYLVLGDTGFARLVRLLHKGLYALTPK